VDEDFDYQGMRVFVQPAGYGDDSLLMVIMRGQSQCGAHNYVAVDLWHDDEAYRTIVLDGLREAIRQAEIALN
jgi:hypothetical protein